MPASKNYIVTQIREVRVTANSAIDAARIGDAALDYNANAAGVAVDGVWGKTTRGVEVTDIAAREEF